MHFLLTESVKVLMKLYPNMSVSQEVAAEHYDRSVCQRAFSQWREYIDVIHTMYEDQQRAEMHHNRGTQSRVLEAWRQVSVIHVYHHQLVKNMRSLVLMVNSRIKSSSLVFGADFAVLVLNYGISITITCMLEIP